MALLPGWDRERLATAAPSDVAAARWIAFTTAVRPIVSRDLEGELEEIALSEMSPRALELARKRIRAKNRESIQRARRQQHELRELLALDGDDD